MGSAALCNAAAPALLIHFCFSRKQKMVVWPRQDFCYVQTRQVSCQNDHLIRLWIMKGYWYCNVIPMGLEMGFIQCHKYCWNEVCGMGHVAWSVLPWADPGRRSSHQPAPMPEYTRIVNFQYGNSIWGPNWIGVLSSPCPWEKTKDSTKHH